MKHLIAVLVIWSTSQICAQIDTNWVWYQQSDSFFKNLDFSAVPHDMLLEHGFPLINFDHYRGDTSDWKADGPIRPGVLYLVHGGAGFNCAFA